MDRKPNPLIKVFSIAIVMILFLMFKGNTSSANAIAGVTLVPMISSPTLWLEPTETKTPAPTKTKTPIPTKTKTPIPTKTKTPTPTKTKTPTSTSTSTATSTPTVTATPTPVLVSEGNLSSQINGGPGIVTIYGLTVGMQYRIVVTGAVNYNPWILVDPQWHDFQATSGCFCQRANFIVFNGVPLVAQNGQIVYDPNHSYTFLWLADSTELQMYTSDSLYSDNYGDFTYQIFEDAYIGTLTPTPTNTPTLTPTSTATPIPTVTPTPTNTPMPSWYVGNDRYGAYVVKADISAPAQAPYIEDIESSGESNWVSIPAPYWLQTGWRYYYDWSGATPYIEWKVYQPMPGEEAYYIYNYRDDLQAWNSSVEYQVWYSNGVWCAQAGNNLRVCKDVGVSPPIRVYAHSEVHSSSLNELDVNFANVYYMDANGVWHLFDHDLFWIDPPYDVDQFFYHQFRNYGP